MYRKKSSSRCSSYKQPIVTDVGGMVSWTKNQMPPFDSDCFQTK